MDTKVKGIIIKLIDYKDADKLAQIFSFDEGVITAKFVGVKKEKAKFKAVAQPFVFAEFVLSVKGEHKTVTSVEMIDPFDKLLLDYPRTMAGYVVLDMIRRLIPEGKPEQDIFLLTLSTLKKLETEDVNSTLIDYIIKFIDMQGMAIEFPNSKYVYLDNLTGNFSTTRTINSTEIDKKVYSYLYNIENFHGAISNEIKTNETTQNKNVEKNNPNNTNFLTTQKGSVLNKDDLIDKSNKYKVDIQNNNSNSTQNAISTLTIKQALRIMKNIIYLKFNVEIKAFHYLFY